MAAAYLHSIWCDDIRAETLNKLTFVGVYSGRAVFPARPAAFLKLCVFSTFSFPLKEQRGKLKVSVRRDDGTELAGAEAPTAPPDGVEEIAEGMTMRSIQVGIQMQQVVLPDSCKYLYVRADLEDGSVFNGPKLWIQVAPSSPSDA